MSKHLSSSWRGWLRRTFGTQAARRQNRRTNQLRLETLEDRSLPSAGFTPGPYLAPAANRTDLQLGSMGGVLEPFLAINTTDPGNIAIGSNNVLVLSTDAGGSFPTGINFPSPPGTMTKEGDSSLAFDADGRLFWSTLKGIVPGNADVAVAQIYPNGPNIGKTASTQFVFIDNGNDDDKDMIAADANPQSPYKNNLYVVWTKVADDTATAGVYFSRSTTHGVSWSSPQQLASFAAEGFVWPSHVAVGPDGSVYVTYHSQTGYLGSNPDGLSGATVVLRSINGGVSFLPKTLAFSPGQSDITWNVQSSPSGNIPGATFWTIGSSQPWVLSDPVRPNNVYVVAADDPDNFHGLGDDANIVFARSANNGLTWTRSTISSGPINVPGTINNSFQLFPTAAIDRLGNIVVAWYDNRRGLTNAAGHYKLDVMARYSTDGGLTWSPEILVSDPGNAIDPDLAALNRFDGPPATTWMYEYFGIALFDGTAYVTWNGNPAAADPTKRLLNFDAFPINGTLTINGDDAGVVTDDTIVVDQIAGNPGFFEVLVNGKRQYAGLLAALSGGIHIDGKGGNDTLTIDLDTDSTANVTYTITGTTVVRTGLPTISYAHFENLEVKTGGADSIVANVLSSHLNTATTVNGARTVNVGNAGLVSGIAGPVFVKNPTKPTNLTVDDSADNVVHTVTLDTLVDWGTFGLISGLAPVVINYEYFPTNNLTVNTGTGGAAVNVKRTVNPVTLIGHANGTVNVGNAGSVKEIYGNLTITDPPAYITLNVDDSADQTARNVTLETVSGSNFGRISGLALGFIKYKYADTANMTLQTGTGGATVNVKGTKTPVTLIGHATGIVNVGDVGSVQEIKGDLTISDPPAYVTLNVDDSADGAPHMGVTLDTLTVNGAAFGRIHDLAPADIRYKYVDTSGVTVQTGTGTGTTVNVKATNTPVNLIGHASGTVNVGDAGSAQQIYGTLSISDPPSNIVHPLTLNVDDSADAIARTVTLSSNGTNSTITGLVPAPAPITFTTADILALTLNTGAGADTVNVQASAKPVTINTLGGIGPNVINLGNASNSISDITAAVTINASASDKLMFSDQGTVAARTYTIGGNSVTWSGGPTVTYTGIGALAVNGSQGNDTYFLNGTSATAALTVTGGSGNNTAVSSNTSNIWALSGTNAGSLFAPAYLSPASFTNVQNLTAAGAGGDYFLFADGSSITGNLAGGGHDTLDYRNYSTSVVVDLRLSLTGTNTGVGGTVSGISSVFGGSVAPAGAGVYNLLIGNGGSYLVGGTGRRNLLVAGAAPSILVGGNGEDLMITGTTVYDAQAGLANWKALADYWTSSDDFATRKANLLTGNGVALLDSSTVTGNGSGNLLLGHQGNLLLYNDGIDALSAFDFLFVDLVPIAP